MDPEVISALEELKALITELISLEQGGGNADSVQMENTVDPGKEVDNSIDGANGNSDAEGRVQDQTDTNVVSQENLSEIIQALAAKMAAPKPVQKSITSPKGVNIAEEIKKALSPAVEQLSVMKSAVEILLEKNGLSEKVLKNITEEVQKSQTPKQTPVGALDVDTIIQAVVAGTMQAQKAAKSNEENTVAKGMEMAYGDYKVKAAGRDQLRKSAGAFMQRRPEQK